MQIPGLKQNYESLNQHINITEELKRTTDGGPFRNRWNTERALLEGEPRSVAKRRGVQWSCVMCTSLQWRGDRLSLEVLSHAIPVLTPLIYTINVGRYDLLEDMIAKQEPALELLRLLCLQSLTSGGLRSNKFDFLRREIIQVRCGV